MTSYQLWLLQILNASILREFEGHLFRGLLVGMALSIVSHEQPLLLSNAAREQSVTASVTIANFAKLTTNEKTNILYIGYPPVLYLLEPVGRQRSLTICPLLQVVRHHLVVTVCSDFEASR